MSPEFAFAANSVSLLLPHVEPYLAGVVRASLPDLEPDLAATARDFIDQELAHHREHLRFNHLLASRYHGVARLDRLMGRPYRWIRRTRSRPFQLAFAAASETIAYAIARWTHAHMAQLFAGTDPTTRELFLWHLAEEVEHKSVAFDVHRAVCGSRRYFARAMLLSLALVATFSFAGTLTMAWHDRRIWNPVSWWRLARYSLSFLFELAPTLLVAALPAHHPTDFTDPPFFGDLLQGYGP